MLREIFDMQEGDPRSWETISHFPMKEAIERRRENYRYLLEQASGREADSAEGVLAGAAFCGRGSVSGSKICLLSYYVCEL